MERFFVMSRLTFSPIGSIHSPFKDAKGMPIQPSGARGVKGTVVVDEKFTDGLKDLDGFSHIILIYYFHLSRDYSLKVIPFLDENEHGLFATRAPRRPNPIGISVVRLLGIEGSTLHVENVDIVDATPLLDIKPYAPEFDCVENIRLGWLEKRAEKAKNHRSDERFGQ